MDYVSATLETHCFSDLTSIHQKYLEESAFSVSWNVWIEVMYW